VACLLYPARGLTGLEATTIALPEEVRDLQWASLFDAEQPHAANGILAAQELFGGLPAAVLFNNGDAGNPRP
jgi:hypothetical protein